ncbi:MAG: hypothetical protein QOH67_4156 [Hyphomicrobiales bacterium]|nr:hypothetical protein [Hyphomicrobiales bacterium]
MTMDGLALAAFIILLCVMFYFQMTSPTFLLVSLEIPTVTTLLRGQFNYYFLTLSIAAAIGALALFVAGRPLIALEAAMIAAFAMFARRWFVRHMDAELHARDSGDTGAVRRLRRLHWAGMAIHAIPLAALLCSTRYLEILGP